MSDPIPYFTNNWERLNSTWACLVLCCLYAVDVSKYMSLENKGMAQCLGIPNPVLTPTAQNLIHGSSSLACASCELSWFSPQPMLGFTPASVGFVKGLTTLIGCKKKVSKPYLRSLTGSPELLDHDSAFLRKYEYGFWIFILVVDNPLCNHWHDGQQYCGRALCSGDNNKDHALLDC